MSEVPVERYFGPAEKINITVPALTLSGLTNMQDFPVTRDQDS